MTRKKIKLTKNLKENDEETSDDENSTATKESNDSLDEKSNNTEEFRKSDISDESDTSDESGDFKVKKVKRTSKFGKNKVETSSKCDKSKNFKTKRKSTVQKLEINNSDLKNRILEFLQKNIRPFNLQELMISFKNEISKKQLQSVLTELSDSKNIISKEYGKSMFYLSVIKNDCLSEPEINELKLEIDNEKIKNQALKADLKNLELKLKKILEVPDDNFIKKEIERINLFLIRGETKLNEFENNQKVITLDQMKEIDLEIKKLKIIFKNRNDSFKSAIHALKEGLGKNENDLYEEIGF
ncbi:Homologous-pairing protein 2 [Dictyocoela muelleri]|nr:Homologous-pairing protein 2 [Dictyocoela muelleri]